MPLALLSFVSLVLISLVPRALVIFVQMAHDVQRFPLNSAWKPGNLALHHSKNVYHLIKILTLRNHLRFQYCLDGWHLVLHHSTDIDANGISTVF